MDNAHSEFALIQWNSQKDTFFNSLPNLRNSELHTDVFVSCEDTFYPAHRLILTLSSQYFARAFQLLPIGGYPVFILCGIKKEMLEAILSYIYEGKVTIVNRDVELFMKTGRFLEIAGLMNIEKDIFKTNDNDDNVAVHSHETVKVKQEIMAEDEYVEVVGVGSNSKKQNDTFSVLNQKNSTPIKFFQDSIPLKKNQCDEFLHAITTYNGVTCQNNMEIINESSNQSNISQPNDGKVCSAIYERSKLNNAFDDMRNTDSLGSTNTSTSYSIKIPMVTGETFDINPVHLTEQKSEQKIPLACEENKITTNRTVARKHTRSCCRCVCCNKLFSSKLALDKHFLKMEHIKRNKRTLRYANADHVSDSNINSKKRKKTHEINIPKLSFNSINEENISTGEETIADKFAKNDEKTASTAGDPENSFPSPTSSIINPTVDRIETGHDNSKCHVNELQLYSQPWLKTDHSNDVGSDESTLYTESGSFPFSISNVISVPEYDINLTNEPSTIGSSSDLSERNTLQENDKLTEKVVDSKFKPIIKKCNNDIKCDSSLETDYNSVSSYQTNWNRSVIVCDICCLEYSSFNSFKKHKQTDCKILECPFCFHTYLPTQKHSLDRHISIHAEQENPYTCPECSYRTNKARVMDDHIAIHKGIFRFWCPLCDFKGNSVKELQTHNQCHHPSMKIFD